jgi:hypothetical protein
MDIDSARMWAREAYFYMVDEFGKQFARADDKFAAYLERLQKLVTGLSEAEQA